MRTKKGKSLDNPDFVRKINTTGHINTAKHKNKRQIKTEQDPLGPNI